MLLFSSPRHKTLCFMKVYEVKENTQQCLGLKLNHRLNLELSAHDLNNHCLKSRKQQAQPVPSHPITAASVNITMVLLPKQKPACPDLTFGHCVVVFLITVPLRNNRKKTNISSFFKISTRFYTFIDFFL